MKSTSFLINTAHGPIVDEAALVETLRDQKITGAAIDVFDHEPLPAEHPFRLLPNVLATPHLGYGSRSLYEVFYKDSVANVKAWKEWGILGAEGTDPDKALLIGDLFYEARRNSRGRERGVYRPLGVTGQRLAGELLSANGKELMCRTRAAICKQFERRLK